MTKYTSKDVHVDQLLTNVSIGYSNAGYIADQIFPVVPVDKQSDKYLTYDKSHWFRNEAKIRATGTKSERGGWNYSSDTYFCDRFSYGHEIYDEERDNADPAIQPGMTANLNVIVDQKDNALVVPNRAIRSQGQQKVVTVMHEGQQITIPVQVGMTDGTNTEITSNDLREGDQVVISATAATSNGGFGGQRGPGGFGGPGF